MTIAVIAAGVALWHELPHMRAELMPITGSVAAPRTLYPNGPGTDGGGDVSTQHGRRLLANRKGPVSDISQVPAEGGWINSLPLDLNALQRQNKVVLIDFWAYTCINCIRSNEFSEELWQRYKDHGLVVIGVHSLEFEVGRSPANILAAVERQGLTYPILTDGDMVVWGEFNNHYWPAKYLIDPHGDIVFHQFGEGDYAHEEQVVRGQLKKAGYKLPDYGPPDPPVKLMPVQRSQTPELYAGPEFVRAPYGNHQQPGDGVTTDFKLPEGELAPDRIYLGGQWHGHNDYMQSEASGTIALNYQAQAAYVVLATAGGKRTLTVTLDGKPVPPGFRGKDLRLQDGRTVMTVDEPRLYWPIANHAPYGRHTIRFQVPAGVRLYSFTFGTYQ